MNNIQMKGVESTLSQVVLEDIRYLKQHFDSRFVNSDQTLIKNLIRETESLLEQAKDKSKTYQEFQFWSLLNSLLRNFSVSEKSIGDLALWI